MIRAPSNTYAISALAIGALLVLAGLASALAGFGPARSLRPVVDLFETLAIAIASAGGLGAGSLALRDAASGGLTSSSGGRVLEARRVGAAGSGATTVSTTTTTTGAGPVGTKVDVSSGEQAP